jgi:hypothetical protein
MGARKQELAHEGLRRMVLSNTSRVRIQSSPKLDPSPIWDSYSTPMVACRVARRRYD